jgi:hypothetical protein
MTIRLDAHKPEFHRAAPPQLPVRVATTANLTISTGLNAGDTVDGVTLAAGDRVLVKDQSTGSQNGVYIAGVTPARAFDMEEGVAAYGAVIYVVAGTANGGKTFRNTNTTVPTIGTTALTFADYTPGTGAAPSTADYLVGTANGSLSAEIVVGTTPGGDLGNTWASPTVDGLQGRALASTAPSDGQAVVWDAAGSTWKPGTVSSGAAGHYEVIVDGTAPPVAVTNVAEDDWVYGFVPD